MQCGGIGIWRINVKTVFACIGKTDAVRWTPSPAKFWENPKSVQSTAPRAERENMQALLPTACQTTFNKKRENGSRSVFPLLFAAASTPVNCSATW